MSGYKGFGETVEGLDPHVQALFMQWWRELPRFNYHWDMQSIVALAYEEGYNQARTKNQQEPKEQENASSSS